MLPNFYNSLEQPKHIFFKNNLDCKKREFKNVKINKKLKKSS